MIDILNKLKKLKKNDKFLPEIAHSQTVRHGKA
jgi:hypothetical protein